MQLLTNHDIQLAKQYPQQTVYITLRNGSFVSGKFVRAERYMKTDRCRFTLQTANGIKQYETDILFD